MPMKDLSFYAEKIGKKSYTVIFVEIPGNKTIKTVTIASGAPRNNNFIGGRELVGFTWKYVESPGNSSAKPKKNPET